jgi:hypothetical protein
MKRFITDARFNNDITIMVKDDAAFFYKQEDIRWFEHRKILVSEGMIEDNEDVLEPFYWLPVTNWDEQVQKHLLKKYWVRQEMLDYIEEELNKLKNK